MTTVGHARARVVVDLRSIQIPDYRGRGIERRAHEEAAALERVRPDLVAAYLLDPTWPPPGALDDLLPSGKIAYLGTEKADAAIAGAKVFHCPSAIELGRTIAQVRPPFVDHLGMRFTVTAHDLIPLRRPDIYLEHPAQRRRYTARLEVLRSADAVLAVSNAAAADVRDALGVEASRCIVVGSGVSQRFVAPRSREGAFDALRRRLPDVVRPFVVFPGGSDPRKNVEVLLRAYGALDERLRRAHQLVVVGDLPAHVVAHYRHVARESGSFDSLVLTGYVPDETLVLLYQAASLVAFPSLAEGYGLPVAEGLSCGAVACVSDRPPLDEIVPDARARFDPTDVAAMAGALARCLTDDALRAQVLAHARFTVKSWDDVANRVASVLEGLASARRRPWRSERKLAVVSPFPPVPGGVSGYSARLVEAVARVARARRKDGGPPLAVDCFVDGTNRYRVEPEAVLGVVPRDAGIFLRADGAAGGYEHVLYVLGNSECHANALAALRRRPGTVLAHDVRMSGLLALSQHTYGAVPGGLAAAVARNYPDLPEGLAAGGRIAPVDAERYGLVLMKDVVKDAARVLVCSESARRLAVVDVGPAGAGRIGVVPFAVSCLTGAERAAVDAARGSLSASTALPGRVGARRALVASFGIVDPNKRPDVLLDALCALAARGVDAALSLVGPVSEEMAGALRRQADSLGVAERVDVLGDVPWPRYLELLGEADVAVQLRHRSSGECSATVAECLSARVPTLVTATGWMGEIPDDAAAKVPLDCSADVLADAIESLLGSPARRLALAEEGRRWADRHTFDAAAEVLLDELGV